jgi:hypothetical protein
MKKIGLANYNQCEQNYVKKCKDRGEDVTFYRIGHPDLYKISNINNRLTFTEVKSYKGRVTPVQTEMQNFLRSLGYGVEVDWESKEDYEYRRKNPQQNIKLPNVLNIKTYNFNPIKKEDNDFDIIINKLQSLLEEIKLYQRS